jgi:hypothetical protein
MQNILTVILASLALLVGVVAFSHWWNLHGGGRHRREIEARRRAEREAGARARGWHYDGLVQGDIHYRIHGTSADGAGWSIKYDADHGSSSARPKLVFVAPAIATGEYAWIIHDRKTYELSQKAAVRAIVGGLARVAGAFSQSMRLRRSFYLRAVSQPAGSDAFRRRYVLAAIEPFWSTLIDHESERQILHFPFFVGTMDDVDNCFSAALSPEGLRVQLYCDAPDFAVVAHLANLGQHLVTGCVRLKVPETAACQPAAIAQTV